MLRYFLCQILPFFLWAFAAFSRCEVDLTQVAPLPNLDLVTGEAIRCYQNGVAGAPKPDCDRCTHESGLDGDVLDQTIRDLNIEDKIYKRIGELFERKMLSTINDFLLIDTLASRSSSSFKNKDLKKVGSCNITSLERAFASAKESCPTRFNKRFKKMFGQKSVDEYFYEKRIKYEQLYTNQPLEDYPEACLTPKSYLSINYPRTMSYESSEKTFYEYAIFQLSTISHEYQIYKRDECHDLGVEDQQVNCEMLDRYNTLLRVIH